MLSIVFLDITEMPRVKVIPADKDVITAYSKIGNRTQLAALFKCSIPTITNILKKNGVGLSTAKSNLKLFKRNKFTKQINNRYVVWNAKDAHNTTYGQKYPRANK